MPSGPSAGDSGVVTGTRMTDGFRSLEPDPPSSPAINLTRAKPKQPERRGPRHLSLPRVTPPLRNALLLLVSCPVALILVSCLVALWAVLNPTPPFPHPPALSPPATPKGLLPPSHYTFTDLPAITDFVTIGLNQLEVANKMWALPYYREGTWNQEGVANQLGAALTDLAQPAGFLLGWIMDKNEYWKPTSSAQGNHSWQALMAMRDACRTAERLYNRRTLGEWPFGWGELTANAGRVFNNAYMKNKLQLEEDIGGFHADQFDGEDQGQYDDMDLVGDTNRHGATDLNRSAAIFLASLHSTHLPNLLAFRCRDSPYHTPGEEFARFKTRLDAFAERVEAFARFDWAETAGAELDRHGVPRDAEPGWLRRAVLRARGREWVYPCRQGSPFDDNSTDSRGHPWYDYLKPGWSFHRPRGEHYTCASAWRCLASYQRTIRETVLPMLRQSQAGLAEATAFYDAFVVEAGARLLRQIGELVAGRGWEVVEETQIGTTRDGHLVEVARAEGDASSLVHVRNVTIWRRMVLAMGENVIKWMEFGRWECARW